MIIISGPSTIGKNPLINRICKEYGFTYIVPWTTRAKRKEENGKDDYHFITKDLFQRKILEASIMEWDYCLSNYYGYSSFNIKARKHITHGLSRMATRIKMKNVEYVTTVFLMPKNKEKIFTVLKEIYSGKALTLRLELVEEEICNSKLFDYIFTIQENSFELLENQKFLSILEK